MDKEGTAEDSQSVHDLTFLDGSEFSKRKSALGWVPVLRPTTRTLDDVVKMETKRRYNAFADATQLYCNVLRTKGQLFDVVFTNEGDLGFTLVLSRDGADGRTMITVDTISKSCEHSDAIKVSDELMMIYDCLIVQPSREDFLNIAERIKKSMRPIKFTFSRLAQGDHLAPRTIRMSHTAADEAAKKREASAMEEELERLKEDVRKRLIEESEEASRARASKRAAEEAAAMEKVKLAAASWFVDQLAEKETFRQMPVVRADEWRKEAARLTSATHSESVCGEKESALIEDGGEGSAHAQPVLTGSVVRVLGCRSQPSTHTHYVGRTGVVIRTEACFGDGEFATVRFCDAPLNASHSTHPSIVASGGLFQFLRIKSDYLEVLNQAQDSSTRAEAAVPMPKRAGLASEKIPSVQSSQAAEFADILSEDKRGKDESVAVEKEQQCHIQKAQIYRPASRCKSQSAPAKILVDEVGLYRSAAQHDAVDKMEAERRRRGWNFYHPRRGSFVYYSLIPDDDRRARFGLFWTSFLADSFVTKRKVSCIAVDRQLQLQKQRLRKCVHAPRQDSHIVH